jgi:membrane protease YdiL (CAAX protease family)
VAAAALILWAFSADRMGAWASVLKDYQGVPRWFLYGIGVPVFALLNAATEELIFRGVLLEALRTRFPKHLVFSLLLQASAFAAAHYWAGFPNGKLGYLMTFIYAITLGYLRIHTRGLLAPFLAHFTADVVIALLLIALVA